MNIQFKKGVLELCVLSLLSNRDYYGYEMVETISNYIEISEGTIYPLLRRLKADNFVDTYLEESQSGPPRKYYTLTLSGKASVNELLGEWESFVEGVNRIIRGENNG